LPDGLGESPDFNGRIEKYKKNIKEEETSILYLAITRAIIFVVFVCGGKLPRQSTNDQFWS
jgi:ATP-dependent exoDNAse (exonuclease V) beta subunit